jgi:hypothetical protein
MNPGGTAGSAASVLTALPEWHALLAHASTLASLHLRDLFRANPFRRYRALRGPRR